MTQPAPNAYAVDELYDPALNGIVTALANRAIAGRAPTESERDARADDTWTLIESFQPRDAVELLLTGQLVGFNEAFAEGLGELLRGMQDTMKPRARSGLVAIGRLTLGFVDRLDKRGMRPYRDVAVQQPEQPPAAKAPAPTPPRPPKAAAPAAAASPEPAVSPEPALCPGAAASAAPVPRPAAAPQPSPEPERPGAPPPEESSWVDEPYQEYLLETPALLAAQAASISAGEPRARATTQAVATKPAPAAAPAQTATAPGRADTTGRGNSIVPPPADLPADTVSPFQPPVHAPVPSIAANGERTPAGSERRSAR